MITAVFLGCTTVMLSATPLAVRTAAILTSQTKPATSPADQRVAKMQQYYDATKDFSAEFTQPFATPD